jgi:hypothetical protein
MRSYVTLRLDEINPFDLTHVQIDMEPGFSAYDKTPGEHIDGARHCASLLARGVNIMPIAVCRSELVPEYRRSNKPWQRLDGFKRYWGHKLAGRETIACVVIDEYKPGAQHGAAMEASIG